ncbi:hypothetical protein HYPBUDRAFT_115912 [Hyphopichia burtonii NRRL Y-1933]|uniref:GIY-YIG domain-containing protein n=1 Tax=Hyphopichia burtonii NRRL Y-1933 TaxID=984485 RepID=A0A1E4RBI5_9ASCO|nr:hypothetical protein HYPBUDRAFT_115912 [Hyphopichia burtonii NRRL Y-1933]ODV64583.1 hypothetical protein HYPBUDRAFT_115912 [Hyphopichia burtonii NRRL Y-1933]
MISHLKNKGGIYIIINKISRNYYIGSASINRLYTRFSNHMLNYHGSKLIKRSILKYGLNNFIFAILEYYPIISNLPLNNSVTSTSKTNYNINNIKYNDYRHNLFELETMYISLLTPKYNILTEAGSSIGYKHTDETIEKLKLSFTKERRLLLSQLQSSRKIKLSKINSKIIYLYNIDNNSHQFIDEYNDNNKYKCQFKNINTASHYLCCSYKTIQRSLNMG